MEKFINSLEIVVARYGEDISWLKNLPYPITVYSKIGYEGDLPPNIKVVKLDLAPNGPEDVAREANTYLKYGIINNYDNLAGYTVFLQGRIDDHVKKPLWNYFDFSSPFTWIADDLISTRDDGYPHGYPEWRQIWSLVFQMPTPPRVNFGAGGMFMVSREAVYSRSLMYYKTLYSRLLNLGSTITENRNRLSWWAAFTERTWDRFFLDQQVLTDDMVDKRK